ncbi:MAG: HNH endonuclease [Lachnospiraceae bacterium]|nr:HNH endonuclease [Lachnospiraceae bacterium]
MGKTEEWRSVKGYEGFYEVSNLGNVRSLARRHRTFDGVKVINGVKGLSPTDNGNGYLIISLSKDGMRKKRYIHRLVAEAFINKPKGKKYVNHIDYNRKNNNVNNLEWCTQAENIEHSKPNMPKQRNFRPSSGYRYISMRRGRYRVTIKRAKTDRSFSSLEDAIKYRNEVCNAINYTV